MRTDLAFEMCNANRGKEKKVFDWDRAAEIIRERKPGYADAFLQLDREWTGGNIWIDGEIVEDSYTYLASTWAIPTLDIDGEEIPCWKWEHEVPDWGSDTKWPESARRIVEGMDIEEETNMTNEPEFTNEQLQRIDDIHNAVYELCKTLTEKDDLQWDISYIGEIADVACDILNRNWYGVRYPARVTDSDSGETTIAE